MGGLRGVRFEVMLLGLEMVDTGFWRLDFGDAEERHGEVLFKVFAENGDVRWWEWECLDAWS